MDYLAEFEQKSIFILREVRARFENPAVLWSTGKDSTVMLHLIRNAFFGEIPFPVIHIDTEKKFPEIYEFRDRIAKKWNLNLIISKNEDALRRGVSPETVSRFECCSTLKTGALKLTLEKYKFDTLILSIRRDEHEMRNIERYFSPRDKEFRWHFVRPKRPEEMGDAPFESLQPVELWSLYQTDFGPECSHVRVHPILHWAEVDVWKYIKREKIPVNPLYFSKNGLRYRSLGCKCCTQPVRSNAESIDEIIEELKTTRERERAGRSQDKEMLMRRLRALGYM